jgi:hypothetical protein
MEEQYGVDQSVQIMLPVEQPILQNSLSAPAVDMLSPDHYRDHLLSHTYLLNSLHNADDLGNLQNGSNYYKSNGNVSNQ